MAVTSAILHKAETSNANAHNCAPTAASAGSATAGRQGAWAKAMRKVDAVAVRAKKKRASRRQYSQQQQHLSAFEMCATPCAPARHQHARRGNAIEARELGDRSNGVAVAIGAPRFENDGLGGGQQQSSGAHGTVNRADCVHRFQIEHWFRAAIDSKTGIGPAQHIRGGHEWW